MSAINDGAMAMLYKHNVEPGRSLDDAMARNPSSNHLISVDDIVGSDTSTRRR